MQQLRLMMQVLMLFVLETNKMALCRAYIKDGKVKVVHFAAGVDVNQHWQQLAQGDADMANYVELDSAQLPQRKGSGGENLRDTWEIRNVKVVLP